MILTMTGGISTMSGDAIPEVVDDVLLDVVGGGGTLNQTATPTLPAYIAVTSLVLCSVVLAIGVLGNLLVLLVIITAKSMRSSTNIFLMNLSLADLLVLVVCCPNGMVEMYMRQDVWLMGKAMCLLQPYIELAVSHTSVLTILAITVERYYAICLPLRAGVIWTKKKAVLVCVISWMLSIFLTSPVLAMVNYNSVDLTCTTDVDLAWAKVYFMTIISLFFWLPLVVLVLLYAIIAKTLAAGTPGHPQYQHTGSSMTERNISQGGEPAAVTRGRRQVVVMLGTVVVFFFACLLPFKVLTMWIIVTPQEVLEELMAENSEIYFNILYFARIMFYINSAINPILYNTMSSRFREGFGRVFGCRQARSASHLFRKSGLRSSTSTTHTSSTRFSSHNSRLERQTELKVDILNCSLDQQNSDHPPHRTSSNSDFPPQKTSSKHDFPPHRTSSNQRIVFHSSSKDGFENLSALANHQTAKCQDNKALEDFRNTKSQFEPNRFDPVQTKFDLVQNNFEPIQNKIDPAENKFDPVISKSTSAKQQKQRKTSLLRVASILSFTQFLENSKETFFVMFLFILYKKNCQQICQNQKYLFFILNTIL